MILAAPVMPADVTDNVPMRDLLRPVCFWRKIWPRHVTGDAKYGTIENVAAVEATGILAYVAMPDPDQADFAYDPGRDAYRCPEGHRLPRCRVKNAYEVVVDWADAATGNTCPVKAACTAGAYVDRVRGY